MANWSKYVVFYTYYVQWSRRWMSHPCISPGIAYVIDLCSGLPEQKIVMMIAYDKSIDAHPFYCMQPRLCCSGHWRTRCSGVTRPVCRCNPVINGFGEGRTREKKLIACRAFYVFLLTMRCLLPSSSSLSPWNGTRTTHCTLDRPVTLITFSLLWCDNEELGPRFMVSSQISNIHDWSMDWRIVVVGSESTNWEILQNRAMLGTR